MEVCDFTLHEYINDQKHALKVEWEENVPHNLQGVCGAYDIICIMQDIASGLSFIHHRQMVHRDLKPENSRQTVEEHTYSSHVFHGTSCLEDCRFGTRKERNIQLVPSDKGRRNTCLYGPGVFRIWNVYKQSRRVGTGLYDV